MKTDISTLLTLIAASTVAIAQQTLPPLPTFPGSQLVEQGSASALADLKSLLRAADTDELADKLIDVIPDARKELADPFIAERLPFVIFESSEPGQKIADFFTDELTRASWRKDRGILGVELTNSGGDWLRVFSRGTQQVLIHVCGPMENVTDETPGTVTVRTIIVRFRGITPKDVFGPDFNRQDQSEQSVGGDSGKAAAGLTGAPQR